MLTVGRLVRRDLVDVVVAAHLSVACLVCEALIELLDDRPPLLAVTTASTVNIEATRTVRHVHLVRLTTRCQEASSNGVLLSVIGATALVVL